MISTANARCIRHCRICVWLKEAPGKTSLISDLDVKWWRIGKFSMLPSCSALERVSTHWKIPRWQQGWAGGSSVSPVLRHVLFVYWKDTVLLNNHWTHYINWLILINLKSFSLLVTSYIFYIDLVALEVCDLPTASEKALVEQGSTGWNRGSTWVHASSFQANSDDSTRASDSEASLDVGVGP